MPIYFGNNFAREPFQFDSVGNDWEQESVNRPDGFPLYHYLQTQEGVGIVTIHENPSQTVELRKGQGILIAPYVPHSYCNRAGGLDSSICGVWKTEFATFTGPMEYSFKNIFTEKDYYLIDENKGKEISEIIGQAVHHFAENGSDTLMLSIDCYNLMLLIADQTSYTRNENKLVWEKYIKPVISIIEEHYMEDISAKEMADRVFVSQQYLSRIFAGYVNCSVYEYLTNYRINKAKELLLIYPERKVQDIACDVGYSDTSHFIVMFKKVAGMTPVQFRKLHV